MQAAAANRDLFSGNFLVVLIPARDLALVGADQLREVRIRVAAVGPRLGLFDSRVLDVIPASYPAQKGEKKQQRADVDRSSTSHHHQASCSRTAIQSVIPSKTHRKIRLLQEFRSLLRGAPEAQCPTPSH